jgi:hypothetical protein
VTFNDGLRPDGLPRGNVILDDDPKNIQSALRDHHHLRLALAVLDC